MLCILRARTTHWSGISRSFAVSKCEVHSTCLSLPPTRAVPHHNQQATKVHTRADDASCRLYEHSNVERIVRAMPNTPVSIQEGCVVWFPTNEVEDEQLKMVASMFSAIGDHVMVSDERYLDMSTAIAGSGPYYLYLTMEVSGGNLVTYFGPLYLFRAL